MTKSITADEFDRLFDAGEDISDYVDWDTPVELKPIPRPEPIIVQVELSLPEVMEIDEMASKMGVTRSEYLRRRALATA